MEPKVIERNASIDLLRVISMLMIVTLHYLGHGGVLENVELFSFNYHLVWFIEAFSFASVNVFIIISGYFLVKSEFKIPKVFKLWFQIAFYSIILFLIFLIIGNNKFQIQDMRALLPVLGRNYWFATTYLAMYILSPFINKLIKTISKRQYIILLAIVIVMFSILPVFIPFWSVLEFGGGTGIVWFIVLYLIGAYIRLYYQKPTKKMITITTALFIPLIMLGSRIFIEFASTKILGEPKGAGLFYQYNSFFVLVSSVSLFLLFKDINIKNNLINKIIIFTSGLTFGVYLLHDNNFLRKFLWENINASSYANSNFLIVHLIIIVISLFFLCALVEYFRKILFNNLENTIINKSMHFFKKNEI